ncbi:sensor histidine kinase [Flavobacterium sp. SM2513]|uniref:sensor histidine kinase n=1 Tax=Flavobacterium sp. SM2513 TaxID=3424766 RepID=UPI003D7F27B8
MRAETTTDIEIVYTVIYTAIAFLLMTVAVLIFVYYSRKKIIQKEIEKKDLEITYQKSMLNATILVQENERKRIARDLHDDISSKLSIISLNSHLLTSNNLSDEETKEITTNIIDVTAKVLDSTRRIAHDLLPPILEEFGLHAAIEELCSAFTNGDTIAILYKNPANQSFFDSIEVEKHLHIYRILQELINNSIRHGKATQIQITFATIEEEKKCVYIDNGIGFDTEELKTRKGLGLKNIESRVNFVNGTLKISSSIGKGIHVVLNFK